MWITYPGDFEIWLGNAFNNRRTERGAMFPPFWKQDTHYVTVEFSTVVRLTHPETIRITAEGRYNFMLDGKLQYGEPSTFLIPDGEHRINIKIWNQTTPPALFITGDTIHTDSTWLATYEDKIWIDENGVAHGSGIYVPAAVHPAFQTIEQRPSLFRLSTSPMRPVSVEKEDGGILCDFGKETMGYVILHGGRKGDNIDIFYGESREEATDHDRCETLDRITVSADGDYIVPDSKAFRFVHVITHGSPLSDVTALYEFLPFDTENSGSFECSDPLLNKIWDISAYTLDLTTREFFMDGIKRDRWTWSGDAIQSYLMNYYLRFSSDTVKRTIRQLRGKDPVTAHVNTIMDYTFYWFNSVLDYYTFTNDIAFVREIYPRMRSLMDYVLGRTDTRGFADGRPDDWIFVDWVDFPMPKRGVMAFEQILFAKSLQTMAECAQLLADNQPINLPQGSLTTDDYTADARHYSSLFSSLRQQTDNVFWSDEQHAYLHHEEKGEVSQIITKFPNMFAVIYGFADAQRKEEILHSVMLNPAVEPITTPYMRFYELEALCIMQQHDLVLQEMKDYWGGMINEGATSFWEKYIPGEQGTEHLQMYGRPYGKSLCHAWGASPLYILGRYFLGIRPLKPGYEEWECRPHLSTLSYMKGSVPTPHGPIHLSVTPDTVTIQSPIKGGKLYLGDKCILIDRTDEPVTIQKSGCSK